jgi:predicted RNA-binding protein YlqC (UPF0109 family)
VTPAQLLELFARRLVDSPDEVRVDEAVEDGALVLRLHVAPADIGKVIGRNGRLIRALRTVLRATGARSTRRVLVELVE